MAKLTTVVDDTRSNNHHNGHRTSSELLKKEGIKYCSGCGKECLTEDKCCLCGKNAFISEKDSSIIGGYIELAKHDGIKKQYNKYFGKSPVKMNPKRIIHQLLQHKERIGIKKEMVDKIYNLNIS